jgi:hypothetical protein
MIFEGNASAVEMSNAPKEGQRAIHLIIKHHFFYKCIKDRTGADVGQLFGT